LIFISAASPSPISSSEKIISKKSQNPWQFVSRSHTLNNFAISPEHPAATLLKLFITDLHQELSL
jgi:hypothetical protein